MTPPSLGGAAPAPPQKAAADVAALLVDLACSWSPEEIKAANGDLQEIRVSCLTPGERDAVAGTGVRLSTAAAADWATVAGLESRTHFQLAARGLRPPGWPPGAGRGRLKGSTGRRPASSTTMSAAGKSGRPGRPAPPGWLAWKHGTGG
jgi:hypothetical protein